MRPARHTLAMRRELLATALGLAAAPLGAQQNDVWRACSIDKVVMCTAESCTARQPAISIYIGYHNDSAVERAVYLRCAVRFVSCDRYDPVVHRVGAFLVFSLPEHSVFSKLGADNHIIDVAGVKDAVFISRGRCAEAAPPSTLQWRSHRN